MNPSGLFIQQNICDNSSKEHHIVLRMSPLLFLCEQLDGEDKGA